MVRAGGEDRCSAQVEFNTKGRVSAADPLGVALCFTPETEMPIVMSSQSFHEVIACTSSYEFNAIVRLLGKAKTSPHRLKDQVSIIPSPPCSFV